MNNANVRALPQKKQDFLAAIVAAAQASRHHTGIPASITVAQCLLESGWGESKLSTQGRNYFGIKADDSWKGAVLLMPTQEFMGGKWITVTARWRKYDTMQQSIDDHASFLLHNERYRPCFLFKNSYRGFAHGLQDCGYATDPFYAHQLIDTIECYGLQFFDFPV